MRYVTAAFGHWANWKLTDDDDLFHLPGIRYVVDAAFGLWSTWKGIATDDDFFVASAALPLGKEEYGVVLVSYYFVVGRVGRAVVFVLMALETSYEGRRATGCADHKQQPARKDNYLYQ
jgi:hypothetical protein